MISQKLSDQRNATSNVRRGTVGPRKEKEQGELGLYKILNSILYLWQYQFRCAIYREFVLIRFVKPKYVDQARKLVISHNIYGKKHGFGIFDTFLVVWAEGSVGHTRLMCKSPSASILDPKSCL